MSEQEMDPVIVENVEHVRDRFGAPGLRQLIDLARTELEATEAALADLADTTDTTDPPGVT